MTRFNSGSEFNCDNTDGLTTLELLKKAKDKILQAMAAGANVVEEIEIRGRIIKHADLAEEYKKVCGLIRMVEREEKQGSAACPPARTRVRLKRH